MVLAVDLCSTGILQRDLRFAMCYRTSHGKYIQV